jgi:hypothetical protein
MIATRNALIVMTALAAAGLIVVVDMAQSRAQEPSPTASVSARFPGADEIMVVHNIGKAVPQQTAPVASPVKADKLTPASCVHEHWPYVADECLVSSEGPRPSRPSRIIRIERQMADNKLVALN